jgi:hypothetical protein
VRGAPSKCPRGSTNWPTQGACRIVGVRLLRSTRRRRARGSATGFDPEQKSARLVGSAVPADHREREVPSVADVDDCQQQKSSRQRVQPKFFFKIDRHSGRE